MIGDMPSVTNANHAHTVYGLANMGEPVGMFAATHGHAPFPAARDWQSSPGTFQQALPLRVETPIMPAPARRLVQVFIADPDENVPLDKSLLYSGEQKLTDATDQELFFEIEIKAILEKHNAERVQFVNKKVKERTEFLEPVKIRDLKMVVVNVATF
jgi:pyruvate/2-oxoglutarate/acetoin dehydrogenase E1 component